MDMRNENKVYKSKKKSYLQTRKELLKQTLNIKLSLSLCLNEEIIKLLYNNKIYVNFLLTMISQFLYFRILLRK